MFSYISGSVEELPETLKMLIYFNLIDAVTNDTKSIDKHSILGNYDMKPSNQPVYANNKLPFIVYYDTNETNGTTELNNKFKPISIQFYYE